jgi:hypothetical protein
MDIAPLSEIGHLKNSRWRKVAASPMSAIVMPTAADKSEILQIHGLRRVTPVATVPIEHIAPAGGRGLAAYAAQTDQNCHPGYSMPSFFAR